MIIARTQEEEDLINIITPIYAVKEGYVISVGDNIYLKQKFTSFATSSMTHASDYYVKERIATKLIRMQLDLTGLDHIGYYRIMDTIIEEIILYNLNKPHVIPLQIGKKEGLYDRLGKRIDTGSMQSFEVPKCNENIGESYNYIQKYLNPNKTYGLIKASESAKNSDNNIVAVFEIVKYVQ